MLHFTYSLQMYISHKWRIPLHQSFVNSFIVIIWMPYAIDLYSTLLYSYRSFQMKRHNSILSSSDQLRWAKLVGTIRCGLPWVCRFAHALAFPMLLHSKSALTALCVCVCVFVRQVRSVRTDEARGLLWLMEEEGLQPGGSEETLLRRLFSYYGPAEGQSKGAQSLNAHANPSTMFLSIGYY